MSDYPKHNLIDKRGRCQDCDAWLTDSNRVEQGPGKPWRKVCRACFNVKQSGYNAGRATGNPPGRPKKDSLTTDLPPLEEHRLKKRITDLEGKVRALTVDADHDDVLRDLAEGAAEAAAKVTPIRPRERKSKLREGAALILASDWHIEEEVRPEQVAGRNRYDLTISRRRAQRFFEGVRWGIEFNRQAYKIRDAVLWFGGDFITNYLHADNRETNLLSPVQAIAEAHAWLSAGIEYLLEDPLLERLVIPCNDGNHGRLTETTRSSSRTASSIEWLLYTMLAREWKHEPRVQFLIAEGEHVYYEVYGKTVRFVHGDSIRYGGGIGGVTIPIYKAMSRWNTVRNADLTCLGHFHQLTSLTDLIVNGSLIGYGPYSLSIGARFEPPAQAFTMLDAKRFKSGALPIWVGDAEDDLGK